MARKQNGGFNRFLNFIGLVDDEDTRDTYGEEYQGGNYGRQAAYTPARQTRASKPQREPQRRSLSESRSSRFDDRPARSTGRSRDYSDRSASRYDDYAAPSRRTSSRFDDSGYDDYAPREPRQSRFAEPQPRPEREPRPARQNLPQPRPQPARMRVAQRSHTVMYSLHSLEDCCEVIDQLIANNTVVLTMDELDGRLLQRAVDTLSGAVFALHASIRKASDRTYLVAPMSVEVNDAFDVERGFR